MSKTSTYFRTFTAGAIFFAAVVLKIGSRHEWHWSAIPPRELFIISFAWIITALLLGVAATRFAKLRSWWGIGLGTVVGWFVVMGMMLLTLETVYRPEPQPTFKSTDEMMVYFASGATKWVKTDRHIELDYSVDSIKVIEEELGRIAKNVNKDHPQEGTFGTALGYGAYLGEVLRRRDGGSWAVDHPVGGVHSYPLTMKSNSVIFPVVWCWKRLINGEEDNVYHKVLMMDVTAVSEVGTTNPASSTSATNVGREKK